MLPPREGPGETEAEPLQNPSIARMCRSYYQACLSVGFSRQEYCSGLPCPPPRELPDPGIEPASPVSPALHGWCFQGYRVATGGFGLEGVRAGEDKERLHLRGSCGLGSFTVGSFACFSAPSPSHLVHNRCYTTLRTENTHVFVRYTFFIRAVAPPRLVSLSFGKTSLTLLSLSPVPLWYSSLRQPMPGMSHWRHSVHVCGMKIAALNKGCRKA